jgi:hypothetical protein
VRRCAPPLAHSTSLARASRRAEHNRNNKSRSATKRAGRRRESSKTMHRKGSGAVGDTPSSEGGVRDETRAHYPQSDEALCCCEYYDRHGNRVHVLQLCCACEEIDEAADRLLRGNGIGKDLIDEIVREVDDRLRVPLPGGAWHIGVPGAVPWVLLPPLLLIGGYSAFMLLLVACAILPLLLWWHRRSLRLRKRTTFLLSWMMASLGFEALIYVLALRYGFLRQSAPATAAFGASFMLTLTFFVIVKRVDPTNAIDATDAAGAAARGAHCAVCAVRVPRYDHYCAWVDEPIGSANHRAYLAFVTSIFLTCLIGGLQLVSAAVGNGWSGRAMWEANRSSVLLSCGGYGLAIACAVAMLLTHQLVLLWSGHTTYEARKERRSGGRGSGLGCFLDQTSPLSASLVASLRARPPRPYTADGISGEGLGEKLTSD